MHNFSMPTYKQFFTNVAGQLYQSWDDLQPENKTPMGWWDSMQKFCFITRHEVLLFFSLAVIWTLLRYFISWTVLKPIARALNLPKSQAEKTPESAWKLLFYSCTWGYSVYLLFFCDYKYFHDAPSCFYGWRVGMPVPTKIFIAYIIQMSFYLHSVYGTLFMDVWRKDSVVMLFHHLVTMLLVGFSYAFRYVNIGILILFCHDITDIVLEGTKLTLYCKEKGGKWHAVCDFLSTIGFLMFGSTWYVFRLYWFPLKAMYVAGYTSQITLTNGPPFYFFFNFLLWVLLGMNIYWFAFIVIMAYRVLTGQAKEVEDVRDFQEEEEVKTKVKPVKNGIRKKKKNI